MKLIDDKLGGTTPLEIILKFTKNCPHYLPDISDYFRRWEFKMLSKNWSNSL